MSVNVDVQGARRKEFLKPTDTNYTTVLVGQPSLPMLVEFLISNENASPRDAYLRLNDGTTDWDFFHEEVPASTTIIREVVLPIAVGETLSCKTGTANALVFTFILVEYGSKFRSRIGNS